MDGRDLRIIEFLEKNNPSSSKEIFDGSGSEGSYATLKRRLMALVTSNFVTSTGTGKGTRYQVSEAYHLIKPIDINHYFEKEIDERSIKQDFDFDLIRKLLKQNEVFSSAEIEHLNELQREFEIRLSQLTENDYLREFERLAIDLSWKSSQIEGNTYSLLETERLLKDRMTAAGKTKEEAIMLLNHKETLDFLLQQPDYLIPMSISGIEDIHSLLVKDLSIERNIRRRRIGISGTNYRPLDNEFQLREALLDTCELINEKENIFEKALLILVLLSYIQAFSDGNKRTARVVSNAILMHYKHCPLSFRTVDSIDYKKAMLLFYEQNNISAFKKIFIEQYEFAIQTYF